MIVDGHVAIARTALQGEPDRVLRALGGLRCVLQLVAGKGLAVHRNDLIGEGDARVEGRAAPHHAGNAGNTERTLP